MEAASTDAGPSLRARGRAVARLPHRFLRGHYGRVILAALGLATGVCVVCAYVLMGRAVVKAFTDVLDDAAGAASIQVSPASGATFPKDVAIQTSRVPGIAQVVSVLTATTYTPDGKEELLAIHAFDIADRRAVRFYGVEADRRRVARRAPVFAKGSILLTEPFARRHGLVPGNRFDLDTPKGRQTFTVIGLFPADGLARLYDGSVGVMDLYAAQLTFAERAAINRVDVGLRPGYDPEEVAAAIRAKLGPGARVETTAYQRAILEKAVRPIRYVHQMLVAGSFLVGFLIAYGSLCGLFERRMWELGVLRAVGLGRATVWRLLVLEGFLVGVLGVLVGIPLGLEYTKALLPGVATATAIVAEQIRTEAEFQPNLWSIALAGLIGIAAALVAAALPAWRAARVAVVETIQNRGAEQRDLHAPRTHRLFLVLAAGGLFAAVIAEITQRAGIWGIAAGLLVLVAAALAARPLVGLTARLLAGSAGAVAGPAARLAAAQMGARPRHGGRMVGMIGVAVGPVFGLWVLVASFERSVIESLSHTQLGDLIVSSPHTATGFSEAPLTDEVVDDVRAVPGVRAAAGVRQGAVPFDGAAIAIDAHDPINFVDPAFERRPLTGGGRPDAWETVARGEAVVASNNFLSNFRRRVGDTVTLATPEGPLALPIAGAETNFTSPRGTLVMSRELYARLWGDRQVNRVLVGAGEGADLGALRAAIGAALGRKYELRVLSAQEVADHFASFVRRAFAAMNVFAAAMLLVVLVGVSEALAAETAARGRDLGTLRVVGARRRSIRRLVLSEGLMVGILGVALAAAVGLVQGLLWVKATFPHLFGWVFGLHVPWSQVAVIALLTVAACLVAGLLPALRSARLAPAAALRYE